MVCNVRRTRLLAAVVAVLGVNVFRNFSVGKKLLINCMSRGLISLDLVVSQ